jgi:Cytochrome domain of cellobiose dehydrogenase
MTMGAYTDAKSGINFMTWSTGLGTSGAFTFGLVLPQDALSNNATEYIGLLVCHLTHLPRYLGGPAKKKKKKRKKRKEKKIS